jgi:hypothetical protein
MNIHPSDKEFNHNQFHYTQTQFACNGDTKAFCIYQQVDEETKDTHYEVQILRLTPISDFLSGLEKYK